MIVTFKKQTRKPFDRDIQWRIQDFPEVGATTLQRGPPTYDFANICQNCMKLKELGARGGGGGVARPKFYYLDPPLYLYRKSVADPETRYWKPGNMSSLL